MVIIYFNEGGFMKNKASRIRAIAQEFDLPEDLGKDGYHIEIFGNTFVLDGCRNIVQYDEDAIRLNTGRKIISVLGSNLVIKDFSCCQATISGCIVSVEIG